MGFMIFLIIENTSKNVFDRNWKNIDTFDGYYTVT